MVYSGRERGGELSGADPDPAVGPRADDEFIALIPLYVEAVVRVAAAMVGPAEAEDVAQEALLRGWQAWPTLRDRTAVRSWLLRIAANVCKDWLRGRSDEALAAYDRALALDPNDAVAWYNKGVALRKMGRAREAEQAARRAKELGWQG
jgi:DNA-directed RNA polymerase specialized sigma24 family protein